MSNKELLNVECLFSQFLQSDIQDYISSWDLELVQDLIPPLPKRHSCPNSIYLSCLNKEQLVIYNDDKKDTSPKYLLDILVVLIILLPTFFYGKL